MRFSDTSFVSGRAPAQTATIRLAGAELPPVQFGNMAETYQGYIDELKGILATRRDETVERNRQLDERVFSATRDPRHPRKAPARADVAPHLNLAPLDNAITALRLASKLTGTARTAINRILIQVEQALTSPDGLPRRSWGRHQISAPWGYTGLDQ